MQITIQIQNALLNRLTQARSDDGVVDFDECIDLSDQGCNDALVALQALYQRKLKENMTVKLQQRSQQEEEEKSLSTRYTQEKPVSSPEPNTSAKRVSTNPAAQSPSSPPPPAQASSAPVPIRQDRKKSSFTRLWHSKTNDDAVKPQTSQPMYERRNTTAAITPAQRPSTASSDQSTPSLSSDSKRTSRASVSSSSDGHSLSSPSLPTIRDWDPSMSRTSTLASTTTVTSKSGTALPKYGGFCKYAHLLRDPSFSQSKALRLANLTQYAPTWVHQCGSIHCKFQWRAVPAKRGTLDIDRRVYQSRGLKWRMLFLAKSHVASLETGNKQRYACLICALSRQMHGEVYTGTDALIEHVAGHSEHEVSGVKLEGSLTFGNEGVRLLDQGQEWDLWLPEREMREEQAGGEPGVPEPVEGAEAIRADLQAYQIREQEHAKRQAIVVEKQVDASDPYANPWT